MDRTEKALKGSIEKWRKIEEGDGRDDGIDNCALCQEFNRSNGCGQCPVAKHAGIDGCQGTPYESWAAAKDAGAFFYSDKSKGYVEESSVADIYGVRPRSEIAKALATVERGYLERLLTKHRAKKRAAAKRRARA